MPAAEIDIDASLVARLVRAQHPDLDGPLWLVAGWALNLATAIGASSGGNPRMAAISAHGVAQVRLDP